MRGLDSTNSRIRAISRKCDTSRPLPTIPLAESNATPTTASLSSKVPTPRGSRTWPATRHARPECRLMVQGAPPPPATPGSTHSAMPSSANTARHGPGRVGRKRQRQGDLSLPLLAYSALGGLRQDPGRGAESSAEAATCGNGGTTARVLSSAHKGAGVRAARLGGAADRLDIGEATKMRTSPTRGSTGAEAPVIRSAIAMRRSTTAAEVSQ
jgi:hypothetical protein